MLLLEERLKVDELLFEEDELRVADVERLLEELFEASELLRVRTVRVTVVLFSPEVVVPRLALVVVRVFVVLRPTSLPVTPSRVTVDRVPVFSLVEVAERVFTPSLVEADRVFVPSLIEVERVFVPSRNEVLRPVVSLLLLREALLLLEAARPLETPPERVPEER